MAELTLMRANKLIRGKQREDEQKGTRCFRERIPSASEDQIYTMFKKTAAFYFVE